MTAYQVPTGVIPRAQPEGAIGDINSTAKGSGARFNAGKAPLELVPLRVLAASLGPHEGRIGGTAVEALHWLGRWQEDGDIGHLYSALDKLGLDGWDECAKAFKYGLGKYAPWNWAKGMAWSVPLACAARHLLAMTRGERDDPESNEAHRGHVFCNVAMLLVFHESYPEGDDRPRWLMKAGEIA